MSAAIIMGNDNDNGRLMLLSSYLLCIYDSQSDSIKSNAPHAEEMRAKVLLVACTRGSTIIRIIVIYLVNCKEGKRLSFATCHGTKSKFMKHIWTQNCVLLGSWQLSNEVYIYQKRWFDIGHQNGQNHRQTPRQWKRTGKKLLKTVI